MHFLIQFEQNNIWNKAKLLFLHYGDLYGHLVLNKTLAIYTNQCFCIYNL